MTHAMISARLLYLHLYIKLLCIGALLRLAHKLQTRNETRDSSHRSQPDVQEPKLGAPHQIVLELTDQVFCRFCVYPLGYLCFGFCIALQCP